MYDKLNNDLAAQAKELSDQQAQLKVATINYQLTITTAEGKKSALLAEKATAEAAAKKAAEAQAAYQAQQKKLLKHNLQQLIQIVHQAIQAHQVTVIRVHHHHQIVEIQILDLLLIMVAQVHQTMVEVLAQITVEVPALLVVEALIQEMDT